MCAVFTLNNKRRIGKGGSINTPKREKRISERLCVWYGCEEFFGRRNGI